MLQHILLPLHAILAVFIGRKSGPYKEDGENQISLQVISVFCETFSSGSLLCPYTKQVPLLQLGATRGQGLPGDRGYSGTGRPLCGADTSGTLTLGDTAPCWIRTVPQQSAVSPRVPWGSLQLFAPKQRKHCGAWADHRDSHSF